MKPVRQVDAAQVTQVRTAFAIGGSLLGLLFVLTGCDSPEEIRTYTVKREAPSSRMLAAIVPQGEDAWFFKLTGPNEAVAAQQAAFDSLLQSVRFSATNEPEWKLPEGWTEQPGNEMRFATLAVEAGGETLECSVSKLPRTDQPLPDFLLANINRWRGQMRQPPLQVAELEQESKKLTLADGKLQATVVNIVGELTSGGMGTAPFAAAGARPPFAGSAASAGPPSDSTIKYKKPDSWSDGELVISRGGISVRRDAAFEVRDGERRVEITVTKLPAAAGATLPNVNRWRGQIGLEALSEEQLAKEKKHIEFGDGPADYVQFFGGEQAILGVIAERQGLVWFVKLQGDAELAGRERQNFEDFVKSIRWES